MEGWIMTLLFMWLRALLATAHISILGNVGEGELENFDFQAKSNELSLPSLLGPTDERDGNISYDIHRVEWIRYVSKTALERRLNLQLYKNIECHFFPASIHLPITACALVCSDDTLFPMQSAALELTDIDIFGISEWELADAKEKAWDHLLRTHGMHAERSAFILQSITSRDIEHYLHPLAKYVDEELEIEDSYRKDGTLMIKHCNQTEDSIAAYYALPLTEHEKGIIHWVIHTIAKRTKAVLLFKESSVRKESDKIEHVHPFRFLSYIIGEGNLRGDLKKIHNDHFKWNGFLKNISQRLNKQADRGNLLPYVDGFAHSLNANPDKIRHMVEKRNWHDLITYFL